MNGSGGGRVWVWIRGVIVLLIVGIIGFLAWGTWLNFDKDKTDAAVAAIHAQKITADDVSGKWLPPVPDQSKNDSTIAGIDANNNGVRDDVEHAIFKKYINNTKIREAELQYAMTEQMFLTRVFNTETWKAVAEENGRAQTCILEMKANRKEVEGLEFNTPSRISSREKAYEFITSYGPAEGEPCDASV
jgi:hypothetical protein